MTTVYVMITVINFVPYVFTVSTDRVKVVNEAKKYAGEWKNAVEAEADEIYFNQEEEGDMENAVAVQMKELE